MTIYIYDAQRVHDLVSHGGLALPSHQTLENPLYL